MQAWKGESYDLLSFMYHVCGNKIIVIVVIVIVIDSSSCHHAAYPTEQYQFTTQHIMSSLHNSTDIFQGRVTMAEIFIQETSVPIKLLEGNVKSAFL